jgi:hypothetical protein
MRNRRKKAVGGALSALFLTLIVLAATGGSGLAAGSSSSGTTVLAGPVVHKQMQPGMRVGHSVRNDISPALRSMPRLKFKPSARSEAAENPLLITGRKLQNRRDTVVQRTMPRANMPNPILNFDGIRTGGGECGRTADRPLDGVRKGAVWPEWQGVVRLRRRSGLDQPLLRGLCEGVAAASEHGPPDRGPRCPGEAAGDDQAQERHVAGDLQPSSALLLLGRQGREGHVPARQHARRPLADHQAEWAAEHGQGQDAHVVGRW